jgi:RNA polymerase sigma-70 factor (ECF subfamily)
LQNLVRSDQLAEELFQQTWISVLDHIDKFESKTRAGPLSLPAASTGALKPPGGGFKAWVYRIATNKANDYWRLRSREKNAREGLKLVSDEETPDASFMLEGTEQVTKLKSAIEKLPENQRQVVLLRYYSGLRFVEIAEMLGCPLNTALGRMHKALGKLKSLMEQK